jgi:hypothetical protein
VEKVASSEERAARMKIRNSKPPRSPALEEKTEGGRMKDEKKQYESAIWNLESGIWNCLLRLAEGIFFGKEIPAAYFSPTIR